MSALDRLPLYHGTARRFAAFEAARFGTGVGYNDLGTGVYLTTDAAGWARYFAREAAGVANIRNESDSADGVVLRVKLRPGLNILNLDDDRWSPEQGREFLTRLGMGVTRPALLDSLDPSELSDPRRVVLDLARFTGSSDTTPELQAMGYDGLMVREPRLVEGVAVDPDARTVLVFDPGDASPVPESEVHAQRPVAVSAEPMPFDRWPPPRILFRGTEPGDPISTLRYFRAGDLGDGYYLTPRWWLAATYGGGPNASVRAGTRVVHAYELDRHVGPGEVAYLAGGSAGGEHARLLSGIGYTMWSGTWSGLTAETASRDAMNRAARDGGAKLIIGLPDSVGINQIAVIERDILEPIPIETVVARTYASFATGNSSLEERYELWDLARQTTLKGRELAAAIGAEFERIDAPVPRLSTPGLTPEFVHRSENAERWVELGRKSYGYRQVSLERVVEDLVRLIAPALAAAARGKTFQRTWRPGKGWGAATAERRACRAEESGPALSL